MYKKFSLIEHPSKKQKARSKKNIYKLKIVANSIRYLNPDLIMRKSRQTILFLLFIFLGCSSGVGIETSEQVEVQPTILTNSMSLPNAFSVAAATKLELTIETFDGSGYAIIWDSETTVKARSGEKVVHNYSEPYTGEVQIVEVEGTQIKKIELGGGFAFDIQHLYAFAPKINTLITNAGAKCYGDVADKPSTLTHLDFQTGDFYGNFNKERLRGVTKLRAVDGNKISFDLADFDQTISYIGVTGMNTATGLLDSLNYPLLHHFDIKGKNTISGNLGNIKLTVPVVFNLRGNNTADNYTTGNLRFATVPKMFTLGGTKNSLSTQEIDLLLIDLDKGSTKWKSPGRIILKEKHAAPSSVSAAARASLKKKGARIFTN